jgi:hypothetical protein
MNQLLQVLKDYGGKILLGFAALVLLVGGGYAFWLLGRMVPATEAGSLPLLAIGGVIVLLLMLTVVAIIFNFLGLTNKDQAMGLPEGSIRAVIALSLIVLFAILSVYLYQGVSRGGLIQTIENLSDTERAQFIRDNTTARDISSQAIPVRDKDGTPLTNADGTPKFFYNVKYRTATVASEDFAKQLLILLGTLMTAITSFYLGAGTAISSAAASQTAMSVSQQPTVSGISPTKHSIDSGGKVINLEISGANLNPITGVKIVRADAQPIIATNVRSNPTRVTCEIPVSKETTPPGAAWDVVVDDGGSVSATLSGALTIT